MKRIASASTLALLLAFGTPSFAQDPGLSRPASQKATLDDVRFIGFTYSLEHTRGYLDYETDRNLDRQKVLSKRIRLDGKGWWGSNVLDKDLGAATDDESAKVLEDVTAIQQLGVKRVTLPPPAGGSRRTFELEYDGPHGQKIKVKGFLVASGEKLEAPADPAYAPYKALVDRFAARAQETEAQLEKLRDSYPVTGGVKASAVSGVIKATESGVAFEFKDGNKTTDWPITNSADDSITKLLRQLDGHTIAVRATVDDKAKTLNVLGVFMDPKDGKTPILDAPGGKEIGTVSSSLWGGSLQLDDSGNDYSWGPEILAVEKGLLKVRVPASTETKEPMTGYVSPEGAIIYADPVKGRHFWNKTKYSELSVSDLVARIDTKGAVGSLGKVGGNGGR